MSTSIDWSRTMIGSPAEWPAAVRSVVDAHARSRLPMLVLWGQHGLCLYNEAFAGLIGNLHPRPLGQPLVLAWPDAGDALRTAVDRARGGVTNRVVGVLSPSADGDDDPAGPHCAIEASPWTDVDGNPLGVLCIVTPEGAGQGAASTDIVRRGAEARFRPALLLDIADEFRFASSREDVMAVALRAFGRAESVTTVGHAEIDLVHDQAMFDEGEPLAGLARCAGTITVDALALGQAAILHRGDTLAVGPGDALAPPGGGARLLVPLVREGRLRSVFVLERRAGAVWRPAEIALAENIASRAWEAIERIQAAATLRRNQARQAFLLVLGDRLRELEDPDDIVETMAESLGRHLRVNRAGYGEVVGEGELLFGAGWSDGSAPPLTGRFTLVSTDDPLVSELGRGLTVTLHRGAASTSVLADIADPLETLLAVPLIRDGRLRGALCLADRADRHWSADEVALVGEVAARLWEALERARAGAALHDLNATLENRVAQRTQELTTSEARFRTLFAKAPAPIFLIRVSGAGDVVYDAVNAATSRFMGKVASEMIGHPVAERTSTGERLLDLCCVSAATGKPVDYELSIEGEGGWRTAECLLAPLPIEDGESQLLIGIARDITAQRQAEEQLRQAQKMEAIGQLTGGIAHDFNNLLTGIIGSLALMEKRLAQGKPEALGRYLELAMSSANRAAALTHRLLAFSRRQPLEAKPVDVSALAVSMEDLLRRTLGEGVMLETIAPDEIWLTLCDPHQLENALLNLAINARDAMPDGGHLTLRTVNATIDADKAVRDPALKAGDYVVMTVTDTGTGMPQDVIARAFDPFFTTKPIGQGTGLGLSMIYGFAKQSDGHVRIESEVGRGTTVKIFLPRYGGPEDSAVAEAPGAVPLAAKGETILIVEDDRTVRGLVLDVLRDLGYRAVEATDGESGLKALLTESRVDLLITDVGLPGMNGRQLAEQARAYRPELSVLFITGYAENAAFGAGHLEAGMQMMTKPFAVEELATKVRAILQPQDSSGSFLVSDE